MRALVVALSLVWTAGSALAHPELVEATPRDGSVVAAAPPEVRLTFTERNEPRLSGAEITDASGKRANAARLGSRERRRSSPCASRCRRVATG